MSRIVIRRFIGLWLVILTAALAWYVADVAVAAVALALGGLLVLATNRWSGRALPHHEPRLLSAEAAGLWVMAAVAETAAPAGRSLRSGHVLSMLGGLAAAFRPDHITAPWATAVDLLAGGAVISSLFVARALRRPGALSGQSLSAALAQVRSILAEYGEDSLSPYVLRPDKQFEIVGDGLVAYTVIKDTVVISADPVGRSDEAEEALGRLVARAHHAGLRVAAYGASERHLSTFARLGMVAVRTGEEAVVDPRDFSLDGRSVRKLRQSVRRIERRGWQISLCEGRGIDARLETQLEAVEARWRAAQPRLLGFAMSMGRFELPIRADDLYVLARSPEGELCAVVRFLAHRDKLSLDVMRRVGETPNGLNESLVCAALAHARDTGVSEVSLNYAGLSHLLRSRDHSRSPRSALTRRVLALAQAHFRMERLIQFNQKFSPDWRARYLVCDSRGTLPWAVWRVLQAEGHLGRATPRTPVPATPRHLPGHAAVNDGWGR